MFSVEVGRCSRLRSKLSLTLQSGLELSPNYEKQINILQQILHKFFKPSTQLDLRLLSIDVIARTVTILGKNKSTKSRIISLWILPSLSSSH